VTYANALFSGRAGSSTHAVTCSHSQDEVVLVGEVAVAGGGVDAELSAERAQAQRPQRVAGREVDCSLRSTGVRPVHLAARWRTDLPCPLPQQSCRSSSPVSCMTLP
jgi:hypothetical protein